MNRVILKKEINKAGIVLCTTASHKGIKGKLIKIHGRKPHNCE
jgi:hypothetical protein